MIEERREVDQRIIKLEIICEQNTQSINDLTTTFKHHLNEDHSQHSEIREAMVNMSNGIQTLTKSVSELRQVVETQQTDLIKTKLWQSRIMGIIFGIVGTSGVVWALLKFVVGG